MTEFAASAIMTDDPTHNKRSTDHTPNSTPTNKEILDAVLAAQNEVIKVRRLLDDMSDAFLTNDIGKKDYEGHRLDHLRRKRNAESFEHAKLAGTLKLVGVVLATIGTIFATGLSVHLQKFFGN